MRAVNGKCIRRSLLPKLLEQPIHATLSRCKVSCAVAPGKYHFSLPVKSLCVRLLCTSLPRHRHRHTLASCYCTSPHFSFFPQFIFLAIAPDIPSTPTHCHEPFVFAPSLGRRGLTFGATSPPCVAMDFVRLRYLRQSIVPLSGNCTIFILVYV